MCRSRTSSAAPKSSSSRSVTARTLGRCGAGRGRCGGTACSGSFAERHGKKSPTPGTAATVRQVCVTGGRLSRETARRGGAGGPIIFADGFDECRNGGRKCAARDGDERDLPNYLGFRDGSMSNAWVSRREFGQEADSHSGGDHSHDPILPLAAIGAPDLHPVPRAKLTQIISVFAVNA